MSEERVSRAKEIIGDGIKEAIEKMIVELRHHGISDEDSVKAIETTTDFATLFIIEIENLE
jgi:hypothetical protein